MTASLRPIRPGSRRRAMTHLVVALIAVNLVWRLVRYLLAFPIWGDEAFVIINLMDRGYLGLVRPLEYGQVVPVGFLWMEETATRVLGFSERALRLIPFLGGVASMLLFRRFASVTVDRWSALLATGIFAASYYPVRHATEVKPYGFDLLVALILLWLAWSVRREPDSRGRWLALIGFGALSIWLSYPAAFTAGGIGLYLLIVQLRARSVRSLLMVSAYILSVAASFAAMFLLVARPHASAGWDPDTPSTVEIWGSAFPPVSEPWRLPGWLLDVHSGNMMAYPVGGRNGGSAATLALVLAGAWCLWRSGRTGLLVMLVSALPLSMLAAAMHRYPYGGTARLAQHLAPVFCLLAGVGLASVLRVLLPRRRVPGAIGVAGVVLGVIACAGLGRDILKPSKTLQDARSRALVRELAAATSPTDTWISFNVPDENPVEGDNLYLRGGHGARHRYDLRRLAPGRLEWAPVLTARSLDGWGTIWLIVYRDDRAPFPEERLERYVQRIAAQRGAPERRLTVLSDESQVEVYRFDDR